MLLTFQLELLSGNFMATSGPQVVFCLVALCFELTSKKSKQIVRTWPSDVSWGSGRLGSAEPLFPCGSNELDLSSQPAVAYKCPHCHTFKFFPLASQQPLFLFSCFCPTQGMLQEIFDHLDNLHWPKELGQKEIKPCLKSNRVRPSKDEKARPQGGVWYVKISF